MPTTGSYSIFHKKLVLFICFFFRQCLVLRDCFLSSFESIFKRENDCSYWVDPSSPD